MVTKLGQILGKLCSILLPVIALCLVEFVVTKLGQILAKLCHRLIGLVCMVIKLGQEAKKSVCLLHFEINATSAAGGLENFTMLSVQTVFDGEAKHVKRLLQKVKVVYQKI